jgi:mono/diheme cytochrome c family protein
MTRARHPEEPRSCARHPEEPRSCARHPEEPRSSRATRDPPWHQAAFLALAALAACRGPAPPARDALQEAFKDDGLSAREARGHRVFRERCATCHGPQGRGDGQNAYSLQPPPPDFQVSLARVPADVRRRIVEGGTASVGRSALCPPSGRSVDPEDVDALLSWLEVASRPAVEPQGEGASPGQRR